MDRPWQSLEDKVVMVTGASSGIGREICLDLATAGCRIVAAARRIDRLESLCQHINRAAAAPAETTSIVRSAAVELDVSAAGPAIGEAVQRAWDAFGHIDALVNNAGVRGGVHSSLDWPEEEWNDIVRTNLTGVWQVSKHVCTRMRDAKRKGSVVNIGSIAGIARGQLPGSLAYSASKSGINALTRVLYANTCLQQLLLKTLKSVMKERTHVAGDGVGAGRVSCESELYKSGAVQIRDNAGAHGQAVVGQSEQEDRALGDHRSVESGIDVARPISDTRLVGLRDREHLHRRRWGHPPRHPHLLLSLEDDATRLPAKSILPLSGKRSKNKKELQNPHLLAFDL